jgi:hypothetical protein
VGDNIVSPSEWSPVTPPEMPFMRSVVSGFVAFASILSADIHGLAQDAEGWIDLMKPTAWQKFDAKWIITSDVTLDPKNPKKLAATPVDGGTIWVNGPGRLPDLQTTEKFGDCEVSLDFLIAKGSNAGIKFASLYEIQILDTPDKTPLTGNSMGGIYPRASGAAPWGYLDAGTPPLMNAAKPAGEWNTMTAKWTAPRFANGVKSHDGRLKDVTLNGKIIHENAVVLTPTGANWVLADQASGPFMVQADHGPLAFRNLKIRKTQSKPAETRPGVEVKGKTSSFTLHIPDNETGFYRGKRFDWSGVIADWKFAGHTVFGPWKATHQPGNADDITGPCEEFGTASPLGYDEAKVKETFVKIGVGELEKPKEDAYSFMKNYRLVNAGKRTYSEANGIHTMTHELNTSMGYGYKLVKNVANSDGPMSAGITLTSSLTNTGKKPITTTVYNHNFFNVDNDPIGPNYRIEFPFDVKAEPQERFAELMRVDGGKLSFQNKLDKGSIYAPLKGYSETEPYRMKFLHLPTKLTLDIACDKPMSSLRIWGISTTICPEPFITIQDLTPGATYTWTTTYTLTQEK